MRRGWWKPWNWSTRTWLWAICLAVLVSPLVNRWCCLWSVPDVALPFDSESLLTEELPSDQDPDTFYAAIYAKLQESQPEWLKLALYEGSAVCGEWDPRLDSWLVENADLLDDFEQATTMAPLRRFSRRLLQVLNQHRDYPMLRSQFRLSQTVAMRFQRGGNMTEAWRWRRAGLRFARQTDAPGSVLDFLVSRPMLNSLFESTKHWASDPSLTFEQLQIARDDIRQTVSANTKLTDLMKAEYIQADAITGLPDVAEILYPKWHLRPWMEPIESPCKRIMSWTIGEPEISLRIYRQVLVNAIDQLDRPLPLRAKVLRPERPMVYGDEERTQARGKLNAARLARILDSPFGRRLTENHWFPLLGESEQNGVRFDGLEVIYLQYDAEAVMIDVVLAAHQYQRDHGEFPTNLNLLVPEYLPSVPIDATSQTGLPLQYRYQDRRTAMVLYADDNGQDLAAEADHSRRGFCIFLKDESPAKIEAE